MLKYLFLLFFPSVCLGQQNLLKDAVYQTELTLQLTKILAGKMNIDTSFALAEPITSYTPAQTGAGNAEVYWPTGATHAVIFVPGSGERGTNKELLYVHGSPIKRVRDGWRPDFAVIAIQPGTYFQNASGGTYITVSKFLKWIYAIFPIKTYMATGLSYGAADWYDYVKLTKDTDYISPYSAVLMSITSESQCTDKTKLCGTDVRWKEIKSWGMCGREDSYHDKQKRYHDAMKAAGYSTRWTSFPGEKHTSWDKRYDPNWKDTDGVGTYDLRPAITTDPPLTINAGRDTTIYFPQDSFIIRATSNAPAGADFRASVIEGFALVDGMIIRNIYKGSVTVRVYVFYNGKQAYDDIVINGVFDPNVVFQKFTISGDGPGKRVVASVLVDGRIIWTLE